jgi:hypothetical protein
MTIIVKLTNPRRKPATRMVDGQEVPDQETFYCELVAYEVDATGAEMEVSRDVFGYNLENGVVTQAQLETAISKRIEQIKTRHANRQTLDLNALQSRFGG